MTHTEAAFDLARTLKPPVGSPLHTILLAIASGELHDGPLYPDIKQEFELTTPRTGAGSMTHTEAADLILRAANKWNIERVPGSYLDFNAAVATVMDAARADALKEAAKVAFHAHNPDEMGDREYSVGHHDGVNAAVAAIRARAQAHREPKP